MTLSGRKDPLDHSSIGVCQSVTELSQEGEGGRWLGCPNLTGFRTNKKPLVMSDCAPKCYWDVSRCMNEKTGLVFWWDASYSESCGTLGHAACLHNGTPAETPYTGIWLGLPTM